MANLKEIRIGEKFTNGYNNNFKIVDYDGNTKVTVEFECGYTTVVTYQNCRIGNVSYPYDKTQCGVGCIGLMSDGTRPICKVNGELTRPYRTWCAMINRCYNEKQLQHSPQYRNVSVCDRWLIYANFLEDISSIPNYDKWLIDKNYEIDKDVLQPGVEFKVYSLETCMFIPKEENSRESINRVHERRIKKEKVVKPVKVIRVTDVETGKFENYKKQEEVATILKISQSYVSRLIGSQEVYNGFRIEKMYV